MKSLPKCIVAAVGAITGGVLVQPALGADITVITTGNIRPALNELQHAFESQDHDKIIFTTQGAAATQRLVESGGAGDAMVGPRPMLDTLLAEGKLKPGSIVDIAASSVGVVVRSGAATPDISTDEKFKQLLLSADSLVYPDPAKGSLGGNLLAALISQWGVADQLKAKTLLVDGGDPTGHAVADGKAHFGINQITEIRAVPGLAFLSPLPPALTDKIVMSAAILSGTRNPEGGAAWISFIAGPAAATVIKAIGMEPVSK
jgi:molybdate transport system substrate-binding protein